MYGIQYLERVKKTGEVGVVTRELVKHKSGNKDVIEIAEKRLRLAGRETGYLISGANGRLVKERLPPL